jgi:hypothetical protein
VVIGGDLLQSNHPPYRLRSDPGLELGNVGASFLLHELCGVSQPQRLSLKLTISMVSFYPARSRAARIGFELFCDGT